MTNNNIGQNSDMRQAFALSFVYLLHYATLGIIFPFAGFFFQQLGFSGTEIGLYLAIFPLMKFTTTGVWTSLFAKSKQKHLFISVAILISSTSLIPLCFNQNKILTGVMLFIFATARTGIVPVLDTLTISLDKKVAYGKIRLFGSLGFMVTSIVVGMLMDKFGIYAFVWSFMTVGLLSIIPISLLNLSGSVIGEKKKEDKKITPELAIFIGALAIYLTSFSFLGNFFNIKIAESGFSQSWAGNMWAIGVISEMVFMFYQNSILKVIKVKHLIAASIMLAGVRYLVTGYTDSLLMLALFSTFHGFGYGTFHIGAMRYIRDYVPERLKLKAQGLYSGVGYGLGSIIGSAVSGVIYDTNGLKGVFTFAFVLCVISAIIILIFTCRRGDNVAEDNATP